MVESTALEMRRTGNRTVGSNPTLSAILKALKSLDVLLILNSGGSAPFSPRCTTAEVRLNSIKAGNKAIFL